MNLVLFLQEKFEKQTPNDGPLSRYIYRRFLMRAFGNVETFVPFDGSLFM